MFKTMSDKDLEDEIRQKVLLEQVAIQLKGIVKLVFGIILFVMPFFSLYLLEKLNPEISPEVLISVWGIIIPLITAFGYVIVKKRYVRLQQN